MSVTFDTLQYVDLLTSAGVPEGQAKAMAKAQAIAIESATDIRLATKQDVQEIKHDVQEIKSELLVMKWMMGAMLAGIGAIVMKLFFIH